jgi:hypothetical protein
MCSDPARRDGDVPEVSPRATKRKCRPSGRKFGRRWLFSPLSRASVVTAAWRASIRRHAIQRLVGVGREHDDAVGVPGAALPVDGVGNRDWKPSRQLDASQLASREEAERAAVSGPEWVVRVVGAAKRAGLPRIEIADPTTCPACVVGDEGDLRAVR